MQLRNKKDKYYMETIVYIKIIGSSAKMEQTEYKYGFSPGEAVSVGEFLDETVRLTLLRYDSIPKDDGICDILRVLSKEETEKMAESGKVSFGVRDRAGDAAYKKAYENARQCFLDGIAALFIDGTRYERLEDTFVLNNGSEAAFVKLSFLSGRSWRY